MTAQRKTNMSVFAFTESIHENEEFKYRYK